MPHEPVVIPEKIYFKIGEVCELLDVQAHVLRYWETEFPMLSPQKNKSGQRSYRRRDVEIALRIKELLYQEMFTIAGARKKLQAELREGLKSRTAPKHQQSVREDAPSHSVEAPFLWDTPGESAVPASPPASSLSRRSFSDDQHEAVRVLAGHLLELREMLKPRSGRVTGEG